MADDNKKVETKTPEPATQPVAPTAGTGKSSKKALSSVSQLVLASFCLSLSESYFSLR